MSKHNKEEIEQAFKIINDNVYKVFAEKALAGNIAAAKLLAKREKTLNHEKLRMELFGV